MSQQRPTPMRPRTQRAQLVQRVVAAGGKQAAAALGKLARRTATGSVLRGFTPQLLICDVAKLGASELLTHLGSDGDTADVVGNRVGFATALGVGAYAGAIGGPLGSAAGAGTAAVVWFATEWFGNQVASATDALLGHRYS